MLLLIFYFSPSETNRLELKIIHVNKLFVNVFNKELSYDLLDILNFYNRFLNFYNILFLLLVVWLWVHYLKNSEKNPFISLFFFPVIYK